MSNIAYDRDLVDLLRSMKRYVSIVLGDDWEVRLTREEGSFRRPFAMVARVGPVMYSGRASIRDAMQATVVQCFPAAGASMDESLLNAIACEEALFRGFGQGVDQGKPSRVPFYNYEGISTDDSATVRAPHEYMRVSDFGTETSLDPDDMKLMIVHADVRVAWRRVGALSSPERIVQRTTVKEQRLG